MVATTTPVGTDELLVDYSADSDHPVTLRIVEDEEDKGVSLLTAESAQELVNFLRSTGVVS